MCTTGGATCLCLDKLRVREKVDCPSDLAQPHCLGHGFAHVSGAECYGGAGLLEGFDFGVGGTGGFAAGGFDDGARMAHAFAGGCGSACDERCDGFGDMFCDEGCSFFFVGASDFADHQNAIGIRVVLEHAQAVDVVHASDGIASDADAGTLSKPDIGCLPDRLIGQRAGAAHDADSFARGARCFRAMRVDISWHDADLAAGIGIWIVRRITRAGLGAGRDHTGAVGPDQNHLA